ncbi:hypothetical protein RJP56_09580 [Shewanella baltica]|uniref:hypothetical protein n=1 Tax=Shewanella baltica TaxID=62322 RepID=UPI0028711154|nr:hypothetical protein [Shewanella baltica]MDR9766301.1 hypothetical protein [Shewanella baltica]
MSNPFDSMKLKSWPDFILAISGITFLLSFTAMVAEKELPGGTLGWVSLMGAIFSFGIAGKIAFKRVFNRDSNKWEDGWRNNHLSNLFILISVGLGYLAYHVFSGI